MMCGKKKKGEDKKGEMWGRDRKGIKGLCVCDRKWVWTERRKINEINELKH